MEEFDILNVTEIKQKDIAEINAKHLLWLSDNMKGERAFFNRAFLYAVDLSGMNFSRATFQDSHIAECYMSRCDMTGADFSGSRISTVNARDTIFDSANFAKAKMIDIDAAGADFANAVFSKVSLANVNFAYANLTNANLILAGYDSRGYMFYAYLNPDKIIEICAGCRRYYGLEEARNHWNTRHPYNKVLTEEIMCNLDKIERVAKVRGWIE